MPNVNTHLLPMYLTSIDLTNSIAVVIDILRASTTITHALVNGAERVIPTQEVDEALAIAMDLSKETYLLGGERGGELIHGFDLDNSPLKYTSDVVRGKTVIFTTTNGTKALKRCATASEVIIGAFVNITGVVQYLARQSKDVHLVCAGTNGQFTGEDILFAGAVTDMLLQTGTWKLDNEQAQIARDFYLANSTTAESFHDCFLKSLGAQNLIRLKMHADLERCQHRDLFNAVPLWDVATNEIRI